MGFIWDGLGGVGGRELFNVTVQFACAQFTGVLVSQKHGDCFGK